MHIKALGSVFTFTISNVVISDNLLFYITLISAVKLSQSAVVSCIAITESRHY